MGYREFQDAARAFATASAEWRQNAPDDELTAAAYWESTAAGIKALVLDPGGWDESLPSIQESTMKTVRANLPGLLKRMEEDRSRVN